MEISKYYFYAIMVVLSQLSCKKTTYEPETSSPEASSLLFPVGRSFLGTSEIKVSINDTEYTPDTIYDSCGSYWVQIPKTVLSKSDRITIQYTRRKEDLILFKEIGSDSQKWLFESFYIDCTNDVLKTKAIELTKNYQNNVNKAKQIHQFVVNHVKLQIYHNSFLDKASRTYELGYGTCMNFSRLYVAMCRAVNIPARSIWGVVYGYNDDNIYDYHHQWGEILDETGYWHPADFNYTTNFDLNDIRYLDLLYAAEENSIIKNISSDEIKMGDVKYFDNYPATLTGKLGFELVEDKRPEYMTVKYTYQF